MPLLHYRVRYAVNQLWVHPDLLGWERTYRVGDDTVTLKLPVDASSFTAREFEAGLMPLPSVTTALTFREAGRDNRTASVHLFMVQAEFETLLDGPRPSQIATGHPYWQQADAACQYGQAVCDAAAHGFLRWLRARSEQPWLGLLAELPRQYGRAGLRYADGSDVMGYGPAWSTTMRSSQLRLEVADLDDVGTLVASEAPVPVSTELLSDARYLDEGSGVPDLTRAVITAAIACEVRTGEVMAERVSADRAKLMQMMLNRTSGLPFILDEVLDASFDLSLKAVDPELWDRVRRLMKHRNAVVHEGAQVDAVEVSYRPAQIAVDLFAWLDQALPA